jgi:hypothetical protein
MSSAARPMQRRLDLRAVPSSLPWAHRTVTRQRWAKASPNVPTVIVEQIGYAPAVVKVIRHGNGHHLYFPYAEKGARVGGYSPAVEGRIRGRVTAPDEDAARKAITKLLSLQPWDKKRLLVRRAG